MNRIVGTLAVLTVVIAAFGGQATLVPALAAPAETGFNTHLRGTNLTPGAFTADVDEMVNQGQKWVRLNIFEDVASLEYIIEGGVSGGGIGIPQLVWNNDALTEYDNAISYAFSKGLKVYIVTNTPSFAANFPSDVYQNITSQYHQYLAARFQGKIAVWQLFNEADIHNFKDYSPISGFDAAYLASLSSAIQAAVSGIKQGDPNHKILIAANVGGYRPDSWILFSWQQYFSALVNNIDVVAVDFYPQTNDDIQKFPAMIQSLKSQFGKEIIVAETGMCTGTFNSDQYQAAIISTTIATLQLAPVDAILLYELRDEKTGDTSPGNCENTLGIKQTDGTQKPAYGEVMRALSAAPSSPSPAVVSSGFNRIDAFMPGEYNSLSHLAWNGSTWVGWEPLGGTLTSLPAAVSWGPGRMDVFMRGLDGSLQHLAWNGNTRAGWESWGGTLTSLPAAVSWGPNRIDVFAIGTDNGLWHIAFDGSKWTGWESLGGDATSPPAVVSSGPGRIDIFIRGNDYGLWHKALNGTARSDWESLGGFLTSAPTAVSWAPNRIDIFIRGSDYGLWHKALNGTARTGWESLGGFLTSAPVAVSSGVGRADVFAAGQNRELLHQCLNGSTSSWCGWESLGGVLSSPPAAVSWSPDRIDVFAQGSLPAQGQQNMLLHKWLNGGTWSGWDPMGTCSGYTSVLAPGEAMPPGACIWADNGSARFEMQRDGNLAAYTAKHSWFSNTVNPGGNNWAVMQGDGNFCVYPNWPAGGKPALLCSNTQGHPGAWLFVQNDGNVVIWPPGEPALPALWATGTYQ
jgi:hypothetical protein